MRRPSTRLLGVAAVLFATALVGEAWSLLAPLPQETASSGFGLSGFIRQIWLAALMLATGFGLLDAWWIRRMPLPTVRRTLPRNLALHDWSWVVVDVEQARVREDDDERPTALDDGRPATAPLSFIAQTFELFDETPNPSRAEGLPMHMEIPPGRRLQHRYRLRPLARGDAHFGRMILRARSPLGLWDFTSRCGEQASVRVYPNFAAVARYGAIALDQHTAQVGIRKQQRRGAGLEFHQLREYRQGDGMRQVDWKATSRKQQLISREYQDERDQQVLFLLDCSRRMRAKDGDLSHFDHVLNAMTLLSHVALKAGDAVGLMSFGEETRWLPARKGVSTVNRILNTIYDLDSSTLASDFSSAAEELCRRQSRRALVILLTNVRREDIDDLVPGVRILSRRHLVLIANLREEKLDEVMSESPDDFREGLLAFASWSHLLERARVQETLESGHALTIDVTPKQLHAQLINRYYAIKRSGVL